MAVKKYTLINVPNVYKKIPVNIKYLYIKNIQKNFKIKNMETYLDI